MTPVSALQRRIRWGDEIARAVLFACAAVSVLTTTGIVLVLLSESLLFFRRIPFIRFVSEREWTPLFSNAQFGIAPLVAGTLLTSAIALLVATPLGLLIAVYLSEYAPARVRKAVKPLLEFL